MRTQKHSRSVCRLALSKSLSCSWLSCVYGVYWWWWWWWCCYFVVILLLLFSLKLDAAERERVAAENEGEAKKILTIKAAEADAESKFLSGEGIARQRQAIVKGLESSVSEFTDTFQGINPQEVSTPVCVVCVCVCLCVLLLVYRSVLRLQCVLFPFQCTPFLLPLHVLARSLTYTHTHTHTHTLSLLSLSSYR
jgi:hypothetical protein